MKFSSFERSIFECTQPNVKFIESHWIQNEWLSEKIGRCLLFLDQLSPTVGTIYVRRTAMPPTSGKAYLLSVKTGLLINIVNIYNIVLFSIEN